MPVIQAEQIGKRYFRHPGEHRAAGVADVMRALLHVRHRQASHPDEFWALKDLSFTLREGDSLGVIGRNGSGKTTLMKMLAGVLAPDTGRLSVNGRVQAMISLGAGFNKRLTGIANVRAMAELAGIVSRSEQNNLIEEVANFSELEAVMDSPVSTYSSGMAARLGFAVCVSLKPQLLIIDEALSVGDAMFKNKCLMKLQSLKRDGVVMVLVSHSMAHILQFCQSTLWLHQGNPIQIGASRDVTSAYAEWVNSGGAFSPVANMPERTKTKATPQQVGDQPTQQREETQSATCPWGELPDNIRNAASAEAYGPLYPATPPLLDLSVHWENLTAPGQPLQPHHTVRFIVEGELTEPVEDMNLTLRFVRENGEVVTGLTTLNQSEPCNLGQKAGRFRCTMQIDDWVLTPGQYIVLAPVHAGVAYLSRGIVGVLTVQPPPGKLSYGVADMRHTVRLEQLAPSE